MAENTSEQAGAVPRHVAIIMDGNGRWARARHLPRGAGHRAGVKSVRAVVEESIRQGVGVLTLFAFSSENWRRPRPEVDFLMQLFLTALRSEVKKLKQNGGRLRVIGDLAAFPERLRLEIAEAEVATAANTKLTLQIAANYGGRWDLTEATRRIAQDSVAGRLDPEALSETSLATHLATAGLPDPDLFIRTGGERRLSNFLLWQSAYAELYFTDLMWPDFGTAAYAEALADYGRRQRRFGQTSEQVMGQGSRALDSAPESPHDPDRVSSWP
ncbi:MAG: di-trans,poly-cis-decaprenylcistransferase [Chromatiaceae bacterium]|jgi:undecaprenyl diphosphate synthase|nr:di-trans,poly-cis-decaprenylcistransferase [Chromatiaceae bacterium]